MTLSLDLRRGSDFSVLCRQAQSIVRQYCATHRIGYTETTLFGSYATVLRHLHALGQPVRGSAALAG